MKNRLKLIPALFAIPLLMANSPAPGTRTNEIADIKVEYSNETKVEDEYHYDLKITNNDSSYLLVKSLRVIDQCEGKTNSILLESFGNEIVLPSKSISISGESSFQLSTCSKLDFYGHGYEHTVEEEYTLKNRSEITLAESAQDYNTFKFSFERVGCGVEEHILCTFLYGGEEHSFISEKSCDPEEEFMFKIADKNIKAEDITLVKTSIVGYVGHKISTMNFGSAVVMILVVLAMIFAGFFVLAGIVVGTVFIVKGIKRSKRRNAEQAKIEQATKETPVENKIE